MKRLILQIPSYVFVLTILLASYFFIKFLKEEDSLVPMLCMILIAVTYWIWIVSVASYFCAETKDKRLLPWIYVAASTQAVLFFCAPVFPVTRLLSPLPLLVNAILLTILIKKVLYARTTAFVFLETVCPLIGMMTLTPDIRAWEESDKT